MKHDNLTSVLIAVLLLAVMAAGTSAWIGARYLLGAILATEWFSSSAGWPPGTRDFEKEPSATAREGSFP